MAQDRVALANLALRKIGSARISSFSDDTPEARIINDVYDDIRDEVLCEGPWTFAQTRATLAQLTITIPTKYDGVSIVYALPTDYLKLNFYSDASAFVKVESLGGQTVILSDTGSLAILYTFRNDNPATYFPNFTAALVGRLAAEIGFNLTQATKKAQLLMSEYNTSLLPKALSTDAQQGTPLEPRQDEWETARRMAGSGLYARPGAQTWIPYWN